MLVLMTAYGSAALGQLFFFHIVLIQKVHFYDFLSPLSGFIVESMFVLQSMYLMTTGFRE